MIVKKGAKGIILDYWGHFVDHVFDPLLEPTQGMKITANLSEPDHM